MAGLQVAELKRVFRYSGLKLEDPSPEMTPAEVVAMYATTYPELQQAEVEGPKIEGDTAYYDVVRSVRTKG